MIIVVADHQRDFAPQLTHAPTAKEVIQAVRMLRDEKGHARLLVTEVQRPIHAEAQRNRLERRFDLVSRDLEAVEFPFHSLQENAFFTVGVLVRVNDVAVVPVKEVRHSRDETFLVATRDKQGGGNQFVRHVV